MVGETLRVLVVDDDPASRKAISGMLGALNRWAFDVEALPTRAQVIQAVQKETWDVILIVPSVESGSGPSIIAEIRSKGVSVPIIVLSNQQSERLDIASMHAGADDWVLRGPGFANDLEQAITRELTKHAQARQQERQRKFDALLCGISIRFIGVSPQQVDEEIRRTLAVLGQYAEVERCFVALIENENFSLTHEWAAPDLGPSPFLDRKFGLKDFEWVLNKVRDKGYASIPKVAGSGIVQGRLKDMLTEIQARSFLVVGLRDGENVIGGLGLVGLKLERQWEENIIRLLNLAGEIISSAIKHKNVEAQVSFQHEFLRHVIDTSPNLIFVKDQDGRYTLVNRAFAELYKRPASEILGKTDFDIHPDLQEAEMYMEDIRQVLETKQPQFIEERPAQAFLGEKIWFQTNRIPLLLPDGKTWQVLSVATDITQRKQVELEGIRLQRELLQSQKMEALGQLASGVAHDLNNALGAIVGHLQLLKAHGKSVLPEQVRSVDVALEGCERATSLIEHLLGFAKHSTPQMREVPIRRIVDETLEFLSRIIGSNIEIVHEGDSNGLFVRADPAQIQQVITNLVINAKQAMPGGGTIRFRYGSYHRNIPERFNVKAKAGEYVGLALSDTGIGIAPEIQDKIFEPFFTTKTEQGGTGLGLSMVYRIMQNHGGWVELQSRQGKGSTFSLYFPRSAHQASVTVPLTSVSVEQGTIMVVDDEPVLVELMQKFLEIAGYRSRGFTSGAEAIRWYEEQHKNVALVILDMKMSQTGGRACFERMKSINPDAKIAILSGYIQDHDVQDILRQGALHFFQKPLKYPEILKWIGETVSTAPKANAVNSAG